MNPALDWAIRRLSLVRLRPFETVTEGGRSKERYRRVALSALGSATARFISVLTFLVSAPLAIRYLGAERYGLWMTITSLVALLGFADLGLGNGLINVLAEASGRDDRRSARRYVSSAFYVLFGVSLFIGLGFIAVYPLVSWADLFGVTSNVARGEAGPAIAIFVACFVVNLPLSVAQRIHVAYQEGFVSSLWLALGNGLALVLVLIAVLSQASLPTLVLAMSGSPVVATATNSLYLFGRSRKWIRPRRRSADRKAARRVIRTGGLFFALSISIAVGYQSDNLVIARILGPEMVTPFAITMKVFLIAPTLLGFLLTPLWPAYGEAIARGDIAWARSTLARSIRLGLLINGPITIGLLIFGRQLITAWAGPSAAPGMGLLIGMGVWAIMNSFNGAIAMFLNGANVVGFQVLCSLTMAAANLALSIVLVKSVGVQGAIYATAITQALFILLPSSFFVLRWLRQRDSQIVADTAMSPPQP